MPSRRIRKHSRKSYRKHSRKTSRKHIKKSSQKHSKKSSQRKLFGFRKHVLRSSLLKNRGGDWLASKIDSATDYISEHPWLTAGIIGSASVLGYKLLAHTNSNSIVKLSDQTITCIFKLLDDLLSKKVHAIANNKTEFANALDSIINLCEKVKKESKMKDCEHLLKFAEEGISGAKDTNNNSFLILKNLCKTLGDDIKTHNSMQ